MSESDNSNELLQKLEALSEEGFFRYYLTLIRQHPGALLSASYVLITFAGILYSNQYYKQFGVPFLLIADLSDFLIIGAREPLSIFMFVGGTVFITLVQQWQYKYSYNVCRKWLPRPKSISRSVVLTVNYIPRTRAAITWYFLLFFVAYAYLFVTLYGDIRGEQIREDPSSLQAVELVKVDSETAESVYLIGSTQNFLIFYKAEVRQSFLVPVENVDRVSPIALSEPQVAVAETAKQSNTETEKEN